jgi:hypothetical protein
MGLLLVAVLSLPACATQQPSAPSGAKVLMMHYMPWYETPAVRGQWGNHWTGPQRRHHPDQVGEDGLPDIWSNYHPLIGPYDSADPDALECHLLQMKLAGVDGVIADWYGIADTADYPAIHTATRALFDATERFGLKFAACYEDRTIELMVKRHELEQERITEHLTETFQWMHTEWFTKPHYLRHQGRPLLLNFGPIYIKDPAVWAAALNAVPDRPALFALHHLWKKAGADGGFTWVHHDAFQDPTDTPTVRRRLHETFSSPSDDPEQVIVSAYPGFKDVYERPMRGLDHRGGDTLRDTLAVGMAGPWPVIQLVTWNDYGEGTIIEPTHQFGYTFLEIVQQARREELGDSFRFTPEDLRLPARLYALRKSRKVPPPELDRIAGLLARGACPQARNALDAIAY